MEIKDLLNNYSIIGVIGNYQSALIKKGLVKDIKVKNIEKALTMVNLDKSIINYKLEDLTISEFWKVELISKLENDIIIVGNISNSLIYKDIEYMKKLFIKLSTEYNKKIVVIDNNLKTFFNLTNKIVFMNNKKIQFDITNFYDKKLEKYIELPPIIDFVKTVNKNKRILNETIDIYELIKDIYRSVT